MGKKVKTGKQRKDKFYKLAKETGYRSRAAFKLIQLNRKFEFLQKSRALVDLCAAPGGWMQVAQKHMPLSSIIIGVDLVPIKPITNCISFQEDITIPHCLQLLRRELKTWKADVVLHDGAPNVGTNWLHDAYQQCCLTLSALKIATEILQKGGWFISKVFRSKDYNPLLWVFQQLFKKVHATKPSASRGQSAEIFVVCQGYLAPEKLDPRFLDAKHVFQEMEVEKKKNKDVLYPEKEKKRKAEGYPEGSGLLFQRVPVSRFLQEEDFVALLGEASELYIDEEWMESHPSTTAEVKECLKDIRVLGRKDLRQLIGWRKELITVLEKRQKALEEEGKAQDEAGSDKDQEEEDAELSKVEEEIKDLKAEEKRDLKRKRKKTQKSRQKLQEKLNLKMVIPGDAGPQEDMDMTLFKLADIQSKQGLEHVVEQPLEEMDAEMHPDDEGEKLPKFIRFSKNSGQRDSTGMYYRGDEDESEDEPEEEEDDSDDEEFKENLDLTEAIDEGKPEKNGLKRKRSSDDEEEEEEDFENPLMTDLTSRSRQDKLRRKAEMFFDKEIFEEIEENEADEDYELDQMMDSIKKRSEKRKAASAANGEAKKKRPEPTSDFDSDTKSASAANGEPIKEEPEPMSDSDSDTESDSEPTKNLKHNADSQNTFEVVPNVNEKKAKKIKLDAEGLAVGTMMVQSKKKMRDIMDAGWNRYAFNDEGLPDWFVEDERKHMRKDVPVAKELVEEYRTNLKEINARPIKKVVEAKARKKRRILKRLERARKKAEAILDKAETSDIEKAQQIKQLYQKAKGVGKKKKNVTYLVAKKHSSGKRMRKPPGMKGPVKVVDPRMKKDDRRRKRAEKKGGKGKKGGARKAGGKKMGGKRIPGKNMKSRTK